MGREDRCDYRFVPVIWDRLEQLDLGDEISSGVLRAPVLARQRRVARGKGRDPRVDVSAQRWVGEGDTRAAT